MRAVALIRCLVLLLPDASRLFDREGVSLYIPFVKRVKNFVDQLISLFSFGPLPLVDGDGFDT